MTLEDLKKIAEAATSGPWSIGEVVEIPNTGGWNTFNLVKGVCENPKANVLIEKHSYHLEVRTLASLEYSMSTEKIDENAKYIAKFYPQLVLALLEELITLRRQIDLGDEYQDSDLIYTAREATDKILGEL